MNSSDLEHLHNRNTQIDCTWKIMIRFHSADGSDKGETFDQSDEDKHKHKHNPTQITPSNVESNL